MVTEIIGRAKVIVDAVVDSRKVEASGGKIGTALKRGSVVGVAALGVLGAEAIRSVHAFEQSESQTRKLNQVLENMGKTGASEEVNKLADSLQRQTGLDDEVIRGGETILATFSEVAATAGEMNGTFERATKLTADLAAAGFGDVNSAAVQLGKALQDPIKGITALNRSGVTFTATQKEQIKNFVEGGKSAEAQNLILKEIEKQVGGTAEAGVTESEKLKVAFGEVEESVGELLAGLIGGGKGKKGLSDAVFDVSDSLHQLATSKDWKLIGESVHTLGHIFDDFAESDFGSQFAKNQRKQLQGLVDLLKWIDRHLGRDNNTPSPTGKGHKLTGNDLLGSGNGVDQNPFTPGGHASVLGGFSLTQIYNGPVGASQGRAEADWYMKHGTRFGAATSAAAL